VVSPINCRHELRFCASLVHVVNTVAISRLFKAFFSVRPQFIRGHPLGRGCATHPVWMRDPSREKFAREPRHIHPCKMTCPSKQPKFVICPKRPNADSFI
jgi:hypothetical protein